MVCVVFLGPAGSGKTTLTKTFGTWLEKSFEYRVAYVNLDPGAEEVPYRPSFDIRTMIRLVDVMRKYGLGPNGGMIKCMDLMLEKSDYIVNRIVELDRESDFVLVDTPGQMEPFVFRSTGPALIGKLSHLTNCVGVIVLDPLLAERAPGLVTVALLMLLIQIRLGIKCIAVINKADLTEKVEIMELMTDLGKLEEELLEESSVEADVARGCIEIVKVAMPPSRVVLVSAKDGTGMSDLYSILHEVYCVCGDLT
ncbi:MAG: GTPase [Thermoprotei archaeon]|nr:MAG: GTPase [Thermoprotei archaeon]